MELPLQVHNLKGIADHLSTSTEDPGYDHYAEYRLKDNFIINLESFEGGFEWVIRLYEVLEDSFGIKHMTSIAFLKDYGWSRADTELNLADRITGLLMRCDFLEFVS